VISRASGHVERMNALLARRPGGAAMALAVAAAAILCAPASSFAQTLGDAFAARADRNAQKQDKLLVDARELVYDRDNNRISAVGEVKLYYQGRTLEADRVVYERAAKRVYAEGHAKMTDETGGVTYAKRFEITDDFKDGFIEGLSAVTADKTRFTSPQVERTAGDQTVFEKGLYTACEPCKDKPERPPLWQVRAARIIHKNAEQMIYYEDARLEFLGWPIAYTPYLSAPDPSVKRKSGFLTPSIISSLTLGYGVAVPYFWNLAPNYDLTFTPAVVSKQGGFGRVDWRHRIETPYVTGSYMIRAVGAFQASPGEFLAAPYGPGRKTERGLIESVGKLRLSDKWTFGWSGMVQSDRWFVNDYRVSSSTVGTSYFKESISTVYLNGQGDRGYFDVRGYAFQGLTAYDAQRQQPLVGPVLDYNKTMDLPAARTFVGGQLEIDVNATTINREMAIYQSSGVRRLDRNYGLYDVCEFGAARVGDYTPPNCLLRGIGGNYSRLTGQATWKRKIIDPIGAVWTPFAFLRAQGSWMSLDVGRTYIFGPGGSVLPNSGQLAYFGSRPNFIGNITPGMGMEWRYPFVARAAGGTHIVEPIAQIVARPNESRINARPNEDAQSLVFDDTNLFEWSKFSGYDRFEGGVRANLGAQYVGTFSNGANLNIMAGQSFQLSGRNSYAAANAASVGINTGLETKRSDYVGRVAFDPIPGYSFVAKARFDEKNFALRRLDVGANFMLGNRLSGQLLYSRYSAQPEIGFPFRREGVLASARYNINKNYWVSASTTLQLDRHLWDKTLNTKTSVVYPASIGLGFGYKDECTTFSVNYSNGLQEVVNGTRVRSQMLLVRLELRTLGEVAVRGSLSSSTTGDAAGAQVVNP
jgi:LPS-assembly protein